MRCRCRAKTGPAVKDYVAKGITVCQEWDDYRVFLKDMGEQPEGTTIDRIDGTKGYSKENCRWATTAQQVENRVSTVWVKANDETRSLKRWTEHFRVASYKLAHARIRNGWNPIAALTVRPLSHRRFSVIPRASTMSPGYEEDCREEG